MDSTALACTAAAAAAALVAWRLSRRLRVSPSRRFVVLALREVPSDAAEAACDVIKGLMQPSEILVGACANAERETWLHTEFSHAALLTFPRDVRLDACKAELPYLNKATIGGGLLALDYEPVVALACSSLPEAPLRHIFFARFKPRAPVGELISGYAGLPGIIKEMLAFEWGRLQSDASAEGYTHIFMTTFADAAGRDAYLAHPAHDAFAANIFSHIDKLVVFDFVDNKMTSS
jgi:hypothetical protein